MGSLCQYVMLIGPHEPEVANTLYMLSREWEIKTREILGPIHISKGFREPLKEKGSTVLGSLLEFPTGGNCSDLLTGSHGRVATLNGVQSKKRLCN